MVVSSDSPTTTAKVPISMVVEKKYWKPSPVPVMSLSETVASVERATWTPVSSFAWMRLSRTERDCVSPSATPTRLCAMSHPSIVELVAFAMRMPVSQLVRRRFRTTTFERVPAPETRTPQLPDRPVPSMVRLRPSRTTSEARISMGVAVPSQPSAATRYVPGAVITIGAGVGTGSGPVGETVNM